MEIFTANHNTTTNFLVKIQEINAKFKSSYS